MALSPYLSPQLQAVLAAQGGVTPVGMDPSQVLAPPTPQAAPAPMPIGLDPGQAFAPQSAPPPEQPPADNPNDGINSVGRPSDQEDPAAAAAKLVSHDHALRKLQRQGRGEALMALGAQLLSSRTFGEGMSKGMLSYLQTLNAARDRNKPKHESLDNGAFDRVTDPVDDSTSYVRTPVADYEEAKQAAALQGKQAVAQIGADGKIHVAYVNGDYKLTDTGLKTTSNEKIAGGHDATSRANAATLAKSRETVANIMGRWHSENRPPNKFEMSVIEGAQNAGTDLQLYDQLDSLVDQGHTGAGAGLWNKGLRAVVGATGQSVGGINPDDMQQFNALAGQLKAKASLMKGQGQISNYERAIMDKALPSLDTNPESIKVVTGLMRAKADRDARGVGIDADGHEYPLLTGGPAGALHGTRPSGQTHNSTTSTGVHWSIVH